MTTIFIQSALDGGHTIKLQSDDPVAFKTCIERLKLEISSTNRTYTPATKTWHVDGFAYHAMQHWLTYCRANLHAQVEWLGSGNDYEPEAGWTPPPPPKQPKQSKADDAFKALHLLPSAPPEVVKTAYRALAQRHHPDHRGDVMEMQKLNRAFEILSKQVAA